MQKITTTDIKNYINSITCEYSNYEINKRVGIYCLKVSEGYDSLIISDINYYVDLCSIDKFIVYDFIAIIGDKLLLKNDKHVNDMITVRNNIELIKNACTELESILNQYQAVDEDYIELVDTINDNMNIIILPLFDAAHKHME